MAYLVGDTIRDTIPLYDAAGVGITGQAAALQANLVTSYLPTGASFAATITEISGGTYQIAFDTTGGSAGQWSWRTSYAGPPVQPFSEVYDVDASTTTTVVAGVTSTGVSRATLRHLVADRMPGEQMRTLIATDGTTTSFTDPNNLPGRADAYAGSDLYFSSGANLGSERRIQSSTSTGQLNWQQPVTTVVAGDSAELWNLRGIGVSASEVNRAINNAILVLRQGAWLPLTGSVATAFDRNAPSIAIPASLTRGIFALDYEDPTYAGIWIEVDGGGEVPNPGWWYDRAGSQIVVGPTWSGTLDTRTVRVRGYQVAGTLTTDADATSINPEAIVTEVVYQLLKRNSTKNPEFSGWAKDAYAEKERARPFAVGRRATDTIIFG